LLPALRVAEVPVDNPLLDNLQPDDLHRFPWREHPLDRCVRISMAIAGSVIFLLLTAPG
jgi:hypothetical protein